MSRRTLFIIISLILITFAGHAVLYYFGPKQRLERKINQLAGVLLDDSLDYSDHTKAGARLVEIGKPAVPALLEVLRKSIDDAEKFDFIAGYLADLRDLIDTKLVTPTLVIPTLKEFLEHKDYEIRAQAAWLLYLFHDYSGLSVFKEALSEDNAEYRAGAVAALGEFRGHEDEIIPLLIDRLQNDEDSRVREYSVIALRRLGDARAAMGQLVAALQDREGEVFYHALLALDGITGMSFGRRPAGSSWEENREIIKKWQGWWEENKDTFGIEKPVVVMGVSENGDETDLEPEE